MREKSVICFFTPFRQETRRLVNKTGREIGHQEINIQVTIIQVTMAPVDREIGHQQIYRLIGNQYIDRQNNGRQIDRQDTNKQVDRKICLILNQIKWSINKDFFRNRKPRLFFVSISSSTSTTTTVSTFNTATFCYTT